jgi:hypothetical protein
MFPFVIKGKVPLGLRRDYHLSEAGLQERIAERLVKPVRRSEMRTDGSHSGDGRGLLAGGLSRLRSLGFLTAVRVRNVRIISSEDFLFASYEMDATTTTLVSMVIIPLVLGSILFSHSAFSFYEALVILILLVITSWGLDVFTLVMMLRHEIYQIASEIRAIMRNRDTQHIDLHHRELSPEDLLATAYYYERNGLVRRCEAYLVHLAAWHPDSFEAELAREHIQRLEGLPGKSSMIRTREGRSKDQSVSGSRGARLKNMTTLLSGRKGAGNTERDTRERSRDADIKPPERSGLPAFFSRSKKTGTPGGSGKQRSNEDYRADRQARKKGFFGFGVREAARERVVRKRRERLQRREAFSSVPDEKNLTRGSRLKLRLSRFLSLESREERRYRKKQERWFHGPRPPRPAGRSAHETNSRKQRRPVWMRSREERQAVRRQERWSQGFETPGYIQRARDKWGKLRLLGRTGKEERQTRERRMKAVEEQHGT